MNTLSLTVSPAMTQRVLQWFDYMGLGVLLAMPLMMFFGIAVCDAAIIGIGVLFVLRSCMTRDFSWLQAPWLRVGLVLWAYLIVISFYAIASPKLSFKQAVPFGRFLFFAAGLQYWLLDQERHRRWMLYSMVAAAVFMATDLIFTFLTGFSLLGKSSVQWHHYDNLTWIWDRTYSRLYGLNGKMNSGIMLTWMALPVIALLLMTMLRFDRFYKTALSALAVVMISCAVLVTGERMALLELCLGYLFLLLLVKPLRKVLLFILPICIVIGSMVLWHSPGLWYRLVTTLSRNVVTFSSSSYGLILQASLHIFRDHPIFGIGLKQYYLTSLMPQYAHFNAVNSHAQNMYLEFLTGTGIIGSVLFLAVLYHWIRQWWQGRKVIQTSVIASAVLIAFILRVWPLASTTSFFFAWGGITFWWMAAWLLAVTKEVSDVRP